MNPKTDFHNRSYTLLLCFTAYGLANLNVLMSIGTILLFVQWFVHPGLSAGWRRFAANKTALAMAGLYLIHVVWIFNTEDYDYALKDLRIKLPLLIFALVLGSIDISRKQIKYVCFAAAVGIWVASIRAYFNYGALGDGFHDFRNIVVGVSHIRLSLLMVLVIAAIVHFWSEFDSKLKIAAVATVVNVVIFFDLIQSASGIAVLFFLLLFTALHFTYRRFGAKGLLATSLVLLIAGLLGSTLVKNYYSRYFASEEDLSKLASHTALGNPYTHFRELGQVENGHYTFINLAEEEMLYAWEQRSDSTLRGDDRVMQRGALIRYLSSKGLTKDAAGVAALSEQDVNNIELGYPSVVYTEKRGLALRFHTTLFGYHQFVTTNIAGGSSLFQRLVFWQAAVELIRRNFWLGTGTGDVKLAFQHIYDEIDVNLQPQYRLRAHNQYLTFWVSFGVVGILWFVGMFIIPFTQSRVTYLHIAFLLIAFISCLTEDTLETQAGVTYFAFFYGLFSRDATSKSSKIQAGNPEIR